MQLRCLDEVILINLWVTWNFESYDLEFSKKRLGTEETHYFGLMCGGEMNP